MNRRSNNTEWIQTADCRPAAQLHVAVRLAGGLDFSVILDARRAVFIPRCQTLLVSDLHWGKGETFRMHGIPIPDAVLQADLARLTDLLQSHQPQRLLVLGDLIHGAHGLTGPLDEKIRAWRAQNPVPITLIAGNHDRKITLVAEQWGIDVMAEGLHDPPFWFSHHPEPRPDAFNWYGHLHPTVQLSAGGDRMRLPCFHLNASGGVLPAFSAFTGGFNIKFTLGDGVFAVAEDLIIPVSGPVMDSFSGSPPKKSGKPGQRQYP